MSDNQFDILEEYIERKYPKNKVAELIGAPVGKIRWFYSMKCGPWIKLNRIRT
jgi:hypothetical protein